jgi:GT2 family glycosyltransferase
VTATEAPPSGAIHVVVIRTDRPADDAARAATSRALMAQTYADWSVVHGPRSAGADGLGRLPADQAVPDRARDVLVITLPEGAVPVPDAFARLAATAWVSGARLITWDADIQREGAAPTPALRFGWSPEALLSADYTNGMVALRLADYRAAAARVPADLALTTWSLLLHLPVDIAPTTHLARPLVAAPPPPAVDDAAAAAVVDAGLRHRGVPATCLRKAGVTRLVWAPDRWPSITLVVPTRHNEPVLGPLLDSLRLTDGPEFDVLVVDNGERLPEHEAWYDRDWGFPLRVSWWEETPFHYGRVNNAAVRQTSAEVVVLLNDDTRVLEPGWLAELVGLATMPGVGCAGSALLDDAGRLQHAGVWLGLGGYAGHLFAGLQPGEDTLLGPTSWYRNTLAVTAACLAVRRELYLAVGGLDERMTLCGSDVALGLDLAARGLRTVCSPLPGMAHLESFTRSSAPRDDQLMSLVRYQPWHDAGDPYGNARLSLRTTRPALRGPREPDPVHAARASFGLVL